MLLEIKNLTKKINGKIILDGVNFELDKGKIIGLLGPNGSGKTTLMKILLSLNNFNQGELLFNGQKLSKFSNTDISFLPDTNFLDKSMKVKNAISQFSYFYPNFNVEKAEKLLKELNLNKNEKIKNLSKGMLEKLNLILVLSKECSLYILDEPIAGVDILTRNQILKLIIENINDESSVIISTHLIKDIEQIFDQVVFIKNGNLSAIYDVEDIRKNNNSVEELYIELFGGVSND